VVDRIQMDIMGLSTSPSSGGAYALILNEVDGDRRLPIIIGTFEAQAIALELEQLKPPRPLTHDLLRNVIQSFGSFVKYIIINDLREGTYYSEIAFEFEGQDILQDARPSDAIALAVRFNAPIYVMSHILEEAGIQTEAKPEEPTSIKTEPVVKTKTERPQKSRIELLTESLNKAISEEDYELAAKIRDEITRLSE
jgi:bifunctional DNase/RNase